MKTQIFPEAQIHLGSTAATEVCRKSPHLLASQNGLHPLRLGQNSWYLIFFCSVILAKLVLVSGNEIAAFPNDSVGYVRQAANGLNQLGAPIGYPFWLWLTQHTGIPQRVAIECLYLAACFSLSKTLADAIQKSVVVLAFPLLAFNPVTFRLFDCALSDALYLSLSMFAASFSLLILQRDAPKRVRVYIYLGFVLGLMSVTRNEAALVIGWLIWLSLFLARDIYAKNSSMSACMKSYARAACGIVIPLITIATLPYLFYYKTQHVWASSLFTLPSHVRLLTNLASIDTGAVDINRVPISRSARYTGYSISPTLRSLETTIENPTNMYLKASHEIGGLPVGEVGGGWVWHIFNDAAITNLTGERSTRDLDVFWNKVNSELESGFVANGIQRRLILHPVLSGGLWQPLLGLIPGSRAALTMVFDFSYPSDDIGFQSSLFDFVANRRTSVLERLGEKTHVQGWAFVDSQYYGKLMDIHIGYLTQQSSEIIWRPTQAFARPDVDSAFQRDFPGHAAAVGFSGDINAPKGAKVLLRLSFSDSSLIIDSFVVNKVVSHAHSGGKVRFLYGLDSIDHHDRVDSIGTLKVQSAIFDWSGWGSISVVVGLVLFLLVVFFLLPYRWLSRSQNGALTCAIFLAGLAVERIFFFGIIHTSGWEVEPRYMSPVFVYIVAVFCCLAIWIPSAIIRLRASK